MHIVQPEKTLKCTMDLLNESVGDFCDILYVETWCQ